MTPSPGPQPLKVLVVAKDRALQRRLSHFLDMMRYHVLQAADAQSALAAVDAESPQFVLLDCPLAERADWELCRRMSEFASAGGIFKFLLIKETDETQLREAFEAGIDDALLLPIGYGELLSRLRAAARVLEYDRRMQQQGRIDALTGLPNRSAFGRLMHAEWTRAGAASPRLACVVLDIDFCGRITRSQGEDAGQALLRAVADELTRICAGSEILGHLGEDTFGVILPAAGDTAAAEWAERARVALAANEFEVRDRAWKITASFGVACGQGATSTGQIIERATEALQTAKFSGRDCVVRWGEFDAGADEPVSPQKLFERTVARDVMTPCAVFLQADEHVEHAVDLLHRTRLEAIPVVDADGNLLGVCERDNVAVVPESDHAIRLVSEVMTSDVQSFDEQASFASLMEFFTHDPRSYIVIVSRARPVGLVSCSNLLALPQPLTTASLAADSKYCDTSEYLLVPDVISPAAERPE